MQTFTYGREHPTECRSQHILLELNMVDKLWVERRSPLLTPYTGSEFDPQKRYSFALALRPVEFEAKGRKFYRTGFEVCGINEIPENR